MKKYLVALFLLLCVQSSFSAPSYEYCKENVTFKTDTVTIGKCRIKVYVAETPMQHLCGMLGFKEDTFLNEGMLFKGSKEKVNYFHTQGMSINIRIMGVTKKKDKEYKVNNEAVYAPIGLKSITVYGDSVFETTEKKYKSYLNKCLFE